MAKINEYPSTTTINSDDYVLVDGDTSKTRKFKASDLDSRGKANKPSSYTDGNLAALDATGNLEDAGMNIEDLSTKSNIHELTLETIAWIKDTDETYFKQVLYASDFKAGGIAELALTADATDEEIEAYVMAKIFNGDDSVNGQVTVFAHGSKPSIDIPVVLIVRGDI